MTIDNLFEGKLTTVRFRFLGMAGLNMKVMSFANDPFQILFMQ